MWVSYIGPAVVIVLGAMAIYYRHQSRKGLTIVCPKCGSIDCVRVTEVYSSKVRSKENGRVKDALSFSYMCNKCGAIRTVANIPVEEEDLLDD